MPDQEETTIPEEIKEIMDYLSCSFCKSMHNPIYSKGDLFNDMVVLYLENINTKKNIKKPDDKNQWFTFFKSRMINKYKRLKAEKRILDQLIQESSLNE